MTLKLITPEWPAPENVVAFTSTRVGGVSIGHYASLNVGDHVGDEPVSVADNRARLPFSAQFTWLNQIHSDRVIQLPSEQRDGDAVITRQPGVVCAVMTADCVPVLLCDSSGQEVAAVHAGWKGLDTDIIGNTVAAAKSRPSQLLAWIGPAISRRHYEVDVGLAMRFAKWPDAITQVGNGKALLDLPLIARHQLAEAGVTHLFDCEMCTYSDSAQFFSHRRATHHGHSSTGRMVTAICLTG